jgi:hypothetical protein
MAPKRLRPLVLALVAVFVLAGCGSDDGDDGGGSPSASGSASAPADPEEDGFDQEAFCAAAEEFAIAQEGAAEESTPDGVEERLTAMTDATEHIVDTAPEDLTEDAQAFDDAVQRFAVYGAERDYQIGLGGASPEYQSGEGAEVVAEITETVAAVDQAVQDHCGHFINEVP